MRVLGALLLLTLAACSEPPRHARIRHDARYPELFPDPRSENFVEELLAKADEKDARAGVWGVPMSDPLGGLVYLAGRVLRGEDWWKPSREMMRRPAPPAKLDGPLPPTHDGYAMLRELDDAIERNPGDPAGYELRANVFDALGWRARAERDRERARILRASPD